ncbi:MAG: hypothetical protein GQ574_17240 [Crocinitomix sp.]|nr:hypothetical protein [Crocinitomix sp.]
MLISIVFGIVFGIVFWLMAQKKDLTPIVWAIVGAGSYYVAQLITSYLIGMYNPYFINNYTTTLVISYASGFVGLAIAWIALVAVAKKKDEFATDDFSNDEFSDV